MPVRLAKLILVLGVLVLTAGCVSDRDIADDPRYPTGFRENTIYYTKVPLVLAVYHGGWPSFTEITGVGMRSTPAW
jgi:hypothetical protein